MVARELVKYRLDFVGHRKSEGKMMALNEQTFVYFQWKSK
jgi:hypothetical protein